MEKCAGCGAEAERLPIVGIGRQDDADPNSPIVEFPVCSACHVDPAHRTNPLKVHFHLRENALAGLVGARISDEKSKRGEDIGIAG